MTNKFLSKSSPSFKTNSGKQEEKLRVLRLCKRKLHSLAMKENISVRAVLIKNTLKIVEKHKDDLRVVDHERMKELNYSDDIEALLNEIDLDHKAQNKYNSSLEESIIRSSSVMEEFHSRNTFSSHQLICNEDLNTFLELSMM